MAMRTVKVTEILTTWNKRNHKEPRSNMVKRRNHTFQSTALKKLAIFCRDHYFFVNTQQESEKTRRTADICESLWIGERLLWIDLDTSMNIKEVYQRLKKKNITGFVFYTSSRYKGEKERRVRIGVITKKKVRLDGQAFFYAKQLLYKLGYEDKVINKVDSSIYGSERYFAPVLVKNKKGTFRRPKNIEKDFFCWQGKPFKFLRQKTVQRKVANSQKNPKKIKIIKKEGHFGKVGNLAIELSSYDKVESAIARNNKTVSLTFKDIKEKTKGGYYIYIDDPCVIKHPNKTKNLKYLDEVIGQKDFLQFKDFLSREKFYPKEVLKKEVKPYKVIRDGEPYLNINIFRLLKNHSLFVESPTGTGKTKVVSEFMQTLKNKSILFISNNRTQAAQLDRSLQKEGLDFDCYISTRRIDPCIKAEKGKHLYKKSFIEKIKEGTSPNRLICGILSLHHLLANNKLLKEYDYIIIDEITSIPSYTVNMVPLLYNFYERFHADMLAFSMLLRKSERVICMDGFIAKSVKDAICKISKKEFLFIRKDYKTNKRIEIFITNKMGEPNFAGHTTCKKYMADFDRSILNSNPIKGRPVIVTPHSTRKHTEECNNYIKHKFPQINTYCLTGDPTKMNRIEEIADMHNTFKRKNIGVFLHSPAISQSVDIPQAQGTNVYHMIDGFHLNSHIHYQMTMRGRKAKIYKVLIPAQLFFKGRNQLTPKESFINSIKELVEQSLIPIRAMNARDKFNHLYSKYRGKGKIDQYAIDYKMSSYLLFMKIYENRALKKKEILKVIKKGELLDKFKDEGLRCAIELELASREWENYDTKYGVMGNYINLLAQEGCIVSKERDFEDPLYKSVDYTKAKIEQKKTFVKKILRYEQKQKGSSLSSSYNYSNKLKCAQRVLHYFLYEYPISPEGTKNTAKLLRKVFKKLKINLHSEKKVVSNKKLLELYNYITKRNFDPIEKEVEKIFEILKEPTDRKRILRMSSFLKLFFNVEIPREKRILSSNKILLKSVKNLSNPIKNEIQIRALYVKYNEGILLNHIAKEQEKE